MLLSQFIAQLQDLQERHRGDIDPEVVVAYPSGDYWRRTITEGVEALDVRDQEPSPYHGAGRGVLIDLLDADGEPNELTVVNGKTVLVVFAHSAAA